LPDTPWGRQALRLLVTAFKRRLTFMIGKSVTTGADHTTVWAGIHHKTSCTGGTSSFGYPDDTYFQRLAGELMDKGVEP
jgi:deltex-like protein